MATRPGGIATRVALWAPKPSNFRRPNRPLRGALRLEVSKSLCFARCSWRRGRGGADWKKPMDAEAFPAPRKPCKTQGFGHFEAQGPTQRPIRAPEIRRPWGPKCYSRCNSARPGRQTLFLTGQRAAPSARRQFLSGAGVSRNGAPFRETPLPDRNCRPAEGAARCPVKNKVWRPGRAELQRE